MLDEAAVRRYLRMADLIPAMARALVDLSAGRSVQPVRQMLQVPGRDGFFAVMSAFAAGALGAKLVTFFPGNTGIHTHHALILLFHPETGEPHTAHTLNPVPFIVVNSPTAVQHLADGRLSDVAPTLLDLLGLPQPAVMTGHSLIAAAAVEDAAG